MVATEVSKFTGNADVLSESVRNNTEWLHLAQNRVSWRHFAKFGRTQVRPAWCGLMLMGDGGVEWSRLASKAGNGVQNGRLRETENERFGEHLLLLSLYQTRLDLVSMSSWYSAGYGWPLTVWQWKWTSKWQLGDIRSKDERFCLKCGMELWRPGATCFF